MAQANGNTVTPDPGNTTYINPDGSIHGNQPLTVSDQREKLEINQPHDLSEEQNNAIDRELDHGLGL